jgi:hypothetical protein
VIAGQKDDVLSLANASSAFKDQRPGCLQRAN